jgi:vitamin B12 transporter
MANLGLDYQVDDQWLIGVNYRTTQDRVDIGNIAMDDYELVDLRIGSEFSKNISGFLRIENLLDKEYVEVNGYNTPGQAAYVGVDVSF